MTKITYYDFSNLQYAAIYLNGFLENAAERGYRFAVSHREPPEFKDLQLARNWLPNLHTTVLIGRYEGAESFLFAIDNSDLNGDFSLGEAQIQVLAKCKYYFKVNYNSAAIAANPRLAQYAEKIRPAPVVFPLAVSQPWRFLPNLTPLGGPVWPREVMKRRMKHLREVPGIDDYRRMRRSEKDIDAFFITPIYRGKDRAHNVEQNARRKILVEGLNRDKRFNIVARYVASGEPGTDQGPYTIPRLSLREYLDLMSRTRVGIYVRGSFGCLSFKFGELMALGSPVVGETLLNNTDYLYGFAHFDEQFAYDEPEALVERVYYLLNHPDRMEELRRANTETFEKNLTPRAIVAGILDQLEGKAPAAVRSDFVGRVGNPPVQVLRG
jgi:hypothetical protein